MTTAHQDIGHHLALHFVVTCMGGAVAFMGYIGSALLLENKVIPHLDPPKLSYGQQCGLISLPLSTLIGASAGFALGLLNQQRRRRIAIALVAISTGGSMVALNLWRGDGIGECNSAIILYYPIFGICSIVATVGLVLFVSSSKWHTAKAGEQSGEPELPSAISH